MNKNWVRLQPTAQFWERLKEGEAETEARDTSGEDRGFPQTSKSSITSALSKDFIAHVHIYTHNSWSHLFLPNELMTHKV